MATDIAARASVETGRASRETRRASKEAMCLILITKYFPHHSSDDCNRFIKVKVLRKLALVGFCKGKLHKIAF